MMNTLKKYFVTAIVFGFLLMAFYNMRIFLVPYTTQSSVYNDNDNRIPIEVKKQRDIIEHIHSSRLLSKTTLESRRKLNSTQSHNFVIAQSSTKTINSSLNTLPLSTDANSKSFITAQSNKSSPSMIISLRSLSNATPIANQLQNISTKSMPKNISVPYTCLFPVVDPWDPKVAQYTRISPPVDCSKGRPSLIVLNGDKLIIDKEKVNKTVEKIDYCKYLPLKLGEHDKEVITGNWSKNFDDFIHLPKNDIENLVVHCLSGDKIVGETYVSRIFDKPEVERRSTTRYSEHMKKVVPAETLSVIIVGMDGMSKHNFFRTMPKTRDFLLNTMKALELNKFNKVGDNTFENVVVLLSGQKSTHFWKHNKWNIKREPFEVIDHEFIWNKFQQAGYRTGMMFDAIANSAFHYLKKGWRKPPFDYYNRAAPLMMTKQTKKTEYDHCVGDQEDVTQLLDYFVKIASHFNNTKTKPYFAYTFFSHISHDYQDYASAADMMYLRFFKRIRDMKVLNNTVFIFFSDHGPRFGELRRTYNGYIESRTPFVFFILPPWFEKKYPKEFKHFTTNQNRLTSFYDIYATLYDILHFRGTKGNDFNIINGTSLFQDIPTTRTCSDAHIPEDYCLCKDLSKPQVADNTTKELSLYLLDIMNEITEDNRDICVKLSIKQIRSIFRFKPIDGKSEDRFQITVQTTPGDGDFEALLSYDPVRNVINLIGDIVRLNFYKGQDKCVQELMLKSFCYCKDTPTS